MDLSPAEVSKAVSSHGILRVGLGLDRLNSSLTRHHSEACVAAFKHAEELQLTLVPRIGVRDANSLSFDVTTCSATLPFDQSWRALGLTPLAEVEQTYRLASRLAKPDARFYMDTVVAPTINAVCNDRSFVYDQDRERFDPLFSAALFGLPSTSHNSRPEIDRFESALPGFPAQGVLAASSPAQLPFPAMQVPQLQKLILDSGKLAKLDTLLTELKANGHRVLVYFQMTRMIDLMEEYLAFRHYKYLRLDGGSTISERRDMVMDWQTKCDFLWMLAFTSARLTCSPPGRSFSSFSCRRALEDSASTSPRPTRSSSTTRIGTRRTTCRLWTAPIASGRRSRSPCTASSPRTRSTSASSSLLGTSSVVLLFEWLLNRSACSNKKLVQDAVVGSSSMSHADASAGAKTNEVVSLLLGEDELEEGLRQAELKRKRIEEKQIEDGKRGAQRREDNKTRKALEKAEAAEAKKNLKAQATWGAADDDEGAISRVCAYMARLLIPTTTRSDSFSFFSAGNTNAAEDEDGQPSGAGTGADTPQPKKAPKAPRKRKVADDDGAPPKAKKPRAKKEKAKPAPASAPDATV